MPVPIGAEYLYRLNFFTGFIVSAIVYWILCKFFPPPALSPNGQWCEVGDQIVNTRMVISLDAENGYIPEDRDAISPMSDPRIRWRKRP